MGAVFERDTATAINLLNEHMMHGAEGLCDAVLASQRRAPAGAAEAEDSERRRP